MKLPNAEGAIVRPGKVTDYLLNDVMRVVWHDYPTYAMRGTIGSLNMSRPGARRTALKTKSVPLSARPRIATQRRCSTLCQ